MSYTTITGMRSNRYPLMGSGDGLGCGCGCGGSGNCPGARSLGGMTETLGGVAVVGVIGLATVGALLWGMQAPKSYKTAMARNRRRRRTSRRRR